jgi:hypothetical protein
VDVLLPECRYLHLEPKFTARRQQWWKTLAFPEDVANYLLEIAKFLGTLALITVTGVLLLMLG